ncbi:MAG: glycosyltransferase family 2 protein [Leptolyngbyaceae cyanobacterium SL_7_1]|nr:glycosyltransferase family 2 protein [Leptolyngbyaceae cyanobacterium SL_7_1]
MNCDFTVVIPTYNGADRLPAVLERLRSQIHTDSITWEIVVVDNNSGDATAAVVQICQQTWDFPLRYCFEATQGLAFARQRGVTEARGQWVGFLDDDNLPDPQWVRAAYEFGLAHPRAAAYGSKIVGVFEHDPPAELQPMLFYLAIVDRGTQPSQYHPKKNGAPPGAGLVVRREAWLNAVPPQLFLVGRVGKTMVAGEDFEALFYLHRHGWEIWHNPAMQIQHLIAANRVEPSYFINMMHGIGLCRHHLRMLLLARWQQPIASIGYLLSDSYKLLRHWMGVRVVPKPSLYHTCERARLMGTLISPFYLLKLRVDRIVAQFPHHNS